MKNQFIKNEYSQALKTEVVHGSDILALRQNFVVRLKKWILYIELYAEFKNVHKKKVLNRSANHFIKI